jgi:hypothetical protein
MHDPSSSQKHRHAYLSDRNIVTVFSMPFQRHKHIRSFAIAVVVGVVASIAVAAGGACHGETPVQLYVDGFVPDDVRFEVESLGPQAKPELDILRRRADVDGALLLPTGSCEGPCRAALVSVFVTNRTRAPIAAPVVRLDAPPGRPRRLPVAFTDQHIERGRIGRIRWLVELWPEEGDLTATLSASVPLEVTSSPLPSPPSSVSPPPP